MNLTIDMMMNLKKYGFAFEEYEHDYNLGMVYYYNHRQYVIGGTVDFNEKFYIMGDESIPETEDKNIVENGIWLPDEGHLMLWLQWKWNYNVTIKYVHAERYFYGVAENSESDPIHGSGPDLLCCLYKLVLKVCKHHQKTLSNKKSV